MLNSLTLWGVVAILIAIVGYVISRQISDGTLKQTGNLNSTGVPNIEVKYPIPYKQAPNLTFSGPSRPSTLEQYREGFSAKFTSYFSDLRGETWTAIGVADPENDPRPFLQKVTKLEKVFAVVGFIGSLASIYGLFRV